MGADRERAVAITRLRLTNEDLGLSPASRRAAILELVARSRFAGMDFERLTALARKGESARPGMPERRQARIAELLLKTINQ